MKIITLDESVFSAAFGIEMAPISSLAGPGGAASFGRVLPGTATTPHQHDEAEAFVILKGVGELIVDNVVYRVGAGSVAVFEPFETHTLRNRGREPLEFLDLFGRDPARATVIEQLVHCRAHRAAGEQNVIDEDDIAAVDVHR